MAVLAVAATLGGADVVVRAIAPGATLGFGAIEDALAMGGACGNGACGGGEDCSNCPADCACAAGWNCVGTTCTEVCGNGTCTAGENCFACAGDCGACCGNGLCEGGYGEDCSTCSGDCGVCCGNALCEPAYGEDCSGCALDCTCAAGFGCSAGTCVSLCGNGTCDAGETCTGCSTDCGVCCGNAVCDLADGETCGSCPGDCGACVCGNGTCDSGEDCSACVGDCGTCPTCSPYATCSGYSPIGGYATTCGNGINPQLPGGSGGSAALVPGLPDLVLVAPNTMIMLGSSATMEYMPGTTSLPACTSGVPASTNEMNKWWITLSALTGTITDFSCGYDNRLSPAGRIDNPDVPDHVVAWMTSQDNDGLLDAYNGMLKFGLMTFDNNTATGTVSNGMWSYESMASPPVGPNINLGCRRPSAERGALISVGLETKDDMAVINGMVQSEALCTIPTSPDDIVVPDAADPSWASRPIGALLFDFDGYTMTSADIAPPSSMGAALGYDPYHACRDRGAVLIVDGAPDINEGSASNDYDDAVTMAAAILSGQNEIKTYVIGIGAAAADEPALHAIAAAGGSGAAYLASDLTTMRTALNTVFGSLASGVTTRTVPAVTSSVTSASANQLEFSGAIEVGGSGWSGRLERTRFCCDEDADDDCSATGLVLDEENNATEGDDYKIRLDNQSVREVFTFSPDTAATRTTFNTSIAASWLNAADATERDTIVNYVLGVSGRSTKLGDIFNSGPVISTPPALDLPMESYRLFKDYFETVGNERNTVVYAGTNDGIFHCFDSEGDEATDPVEFWGFIPPYVLGDLKDGISSHIFTVDGNAIVEDVPLERTSTTVIPAPPLSDPRDSTWYTVAVLPLGNGGRAVYGLDVTTPEDANSVEMLFEFADTEPDSDSDGVREACDMTDTARTCDDDLGYVFSRPVIGRITYDPGTGNKEQAVAIFGGGWDNGAGGTVGRSAFVVSLSDGALVKKFDDTTKCAGETEAFDSPIVGDIAAFNPFTGAFTTRFFAGDYVGRLWRFDTSSSDPDAWCQTVLTPAAYQNGFPIFDAPTLALDTDDNLVVIYGTGDIASLLSVDVGNVVVSLTENITRDPVTGNVTNVTATANWAVTLDAGGEKMTGMPLVFDGCTYFATFLPDTDTTDLCTVGHAKLWGINFVGDDAAVTTDVLGCLDHDGDGVGDQINMDLGDGSVVSGINLVRRPACIETTTIPDPYSSTPGATVSTVTSYTPSSYSITAHIGAGAGSSSAGTIPKVEISVVPPRTGGWATSWGEIFD